MFGTAPCSACGQTIAPNEFVMRTSSPISSQQKQQQQQQQQQQNQHPIQTGHNQTPPGVGGVENQRHFQTHQNLLTHPQHQHHIPAVEHHVFHLKCFACSKCASQLRPGDRYYMLGGSLVCEQDWHKLLKTTSTNPPVRKGKVGRPRRSKD